MHFGKWRCVAAEVETGSDLWSLQSFPLWTSAPKNLPPGMTGILASWHTSHKQRMLFMKSGLLRGRDLHEWLRRASEPPKQKLWSKKEGRNAEREHELLGLQSESTCSPRIVELCFALPAAGPGTGRGRGHTGLGGTVQDYGTRSKYSDFKPKSYLHNRWVTAGFWTECWFRNFCMVSSVWFVSSPFLLFTPEAIRWYCLCILCLYRCHL